MRNSLRMIQYTLYALLIFALSGCGANSLNSAGNSQPGTITAKVTMPKSSAKTAAAVAPASITKIRLKVTGPTIPTATADLATVNGGTVNVYPGSQLIVAVQAFDVTGKVIFEGFAIDQIVTPGADTPVAITMVSPKNNADNTPCLNCHDNTRDATGENIVANFKQSGHYADNSQEGVTVVVNGKTYATSPGCAGCHGPSHNDPSPSASGRCYDCHASLLNNVATNHITVPYLNAGNNNCTDCHNPHNTKKVGGFGQVGNASCILCHAVGQNANDLPLAEIDPATGLPVAKYVNDNSGVRAITIEFKKWSHHVTGVTLQDAHCAACHLEGKAQDGKIVVDSTKHMVDAKTHLRNATTDADMQWDPANPNHTTMDNFCMSCHSATGFSSPSRAAIQAIMVPAAGKTASASNPFGDTISNRYDKMQRPAVVNVDNQFDTTNNSHHAVKGARYSGRTRIEATRRIANVNGFAANSSATLFGARMTIYDAVTQDGRAAFNALYAPLGTVVPPTTATSLGDDSTLHCGDCHTVGQWKAGVATNAAGVLNTAVIGAHGSSNEYLLRNDKGTDERHAQDAYKVTAGIVVLNNPNAANLVCFNCHSYSRYGSAFSATGTTGPHAGEYDASGRCNSQANTIPFNGYTTGTATDGTQFLSRFEGPVTKYGATPAFAPGFPLNAANAPTVAEIDPDFGNVMGIQCANCHNSGAGNAYGGIHGSKNNQTLAGYTNDPSVNGGSYIDGMGNTTKIMRFLPGLGDAMHVPGTLGGVTGGSVLKFKNYSAYAFQLISATGGTATNKRVLKGYVPANYFELPIRDNRPAVNAKVGSYNFTTGGVTRDTNWEQKGWKQSGPNSTLDANQQQAVGAGCYTLGNSAEGTPGTRSYYQGTDPRFPAISKNDSGVNMPAVDPNVMDDLRGPSQGVAGQPNPELWENWGGCDDHGAPIGGGNHGFIKRIVRPVTY